MNNNEDMFNKTDIENEDTAVFSNEDGQSVEADEACNSLLSGIIKDNLHKIGYSSFTEVQRKSIPTVLEGRDLVASAETGSGKTGSFIIPIVEKILKGEAKALVLAPTRELATQISKFGILNKIRSVRYNLVIGGASFYTQKQKFKTANLVISTPGRLNDHIEKGSFNPSDFNIIVLDETDMMLDMNFEIQIREVLKMMPEDKQVLMFSATFPKKILFLIDKYLKDPVKIVLNKQGELPKTLVHSMLEVEHRDKEEALVNEVKNRTGSILVFANTKSKAEYLSRILYDSGEKAKFMHGGLRQNQRDYIIKSFTHGNFRILIATDVLARGISIGHIKHVISFDLPQNTEDYTHRVGRTARANKEGFAVAFISSDELLKSKEISEMLNIEPLERAKNLRDNGKGNSRSRSFGGRRRSSGNRGYNNRDGDSRGSRSYNRDGDSRGSRSYSRDGDSRGSRSYNRDGDSRGSRSYSRDGDSRGSRSYSRDGDSRGSRSYSRDGDSRGSRSYSRDGDSRGSRSYSRDGESRGSRSYSRDGESRTGRSQNRDRES